MSFFRRNDQILGKKETQDKLRFLPDVTRQVKQKRKLLTLHSMHYESIITVRTNESTQLYKSQYYKTPASKYFDPPSPFISEHTAVKIFP